MNNSVYVKKGFWLAAVLLVLHKIIYINVPDFKMSSNSPETIGTIVAFGFMVFIFVINEKVSRLLITGFTGLGFLIGVEIFFSVTGIGQYTYALFEEYGSYYNEDWFLIYLSGIIGSAIGAVLTITLTLMKVRFNFFPKREETDMENTFKNKLIVYFLVSAVSFTYLVLPENAGVSVPVFALLQLVCLWFVVPDRKRLWLYIPVLIMSANAFISGNTMFRVPNVIVSVIVYAVMFVDFNIKDTTARFLVNILERMVEPLKHFVLPYKWGLEINKEKAPVIKRVLIALAVTVPSLIIAAAILSSADMVFSHGVADFFKELSKYVNLNMVLKTLFGMAVGTYLLGVIYTAHHKKETAPDDAKERHGDLIVLNTLLSSLLVVYTLFVAIQFKYLFALSALPYNLSYADYARKGFFELLFLSGVNIALILLTVSLSKQKRGGWASFTKALSCYLCLTTIVMLASSFFRMMLYSDSDGLTRLRFMVLGFLIFESLGLLVTLAYILKPKFNIIAVYLSIALVYYMILNLVPIDRYIAESQINQYMRGGRVGLHYTMTLSTDAAPQIARLLEYEDIDDLNKAMAESYFENIHTWYNDFVPKWQRTNLSVRNALQNPFTVRYRQ